MFFKRSAMNIGFLQQTAEDYDLPYEIVERIYLRSTSTLNLYERLEEHLRERADLMRDILNDQN